MPAAQPSPFGPDLPLPTQPWRDRLVGAVLLAALIAAWAVDLAPVATVRLWAFDLAASLRPAPERAPTVAVVDIDDQSLAASGQWPWPRHVLADTVARLADHGAAVVVLDMLLAEPDRLGDHDETLASAMARVPVVAGAAIPMLQPMPVGRDPIVGRFATRGVPDAGRLPRASALVRALPVIEAAAAGIGLVNLYPDLDGATRTVLGGVIVGDAAVPGIAIETVRVAAGATNLVIEAPTRLGPEGISIADRLVPADVEGRIWVDARSPGRVPVIPVHRLLSGQVDGAEIAGRVVVFGASAAGIASTVRTASGGGVPGSLFQAMAIDSVLQGRVLARPPVAALVELGLTLAVGLAVVAASPWLGLRTLGAVALATASTLSAGAALASISGGILVDASLPLLAGLFLSGHVAIVRLREQVLIRRRQSALLARQDAYMRQVVDASFDAIVTVDRQARILTANAGAERLFGMPADRLAGTRIDAQLSGIFADAVRTQTDRALSDVVRNRQVVGASVRRPDGAAVPAEITVAETTMADQVFVIVLRDISARLGAEEAARRAGERLRDGIERITDGFALFGPDRRLVICNARFVAMLGDAGPVVSPGIRYDVIMECYARTSCAPVDALDRVDEWLSERMVAFLEPVPPRAQEGQDGRWFRIDERPTAEGGLVGVYSDITELKWREMEMTEAMRRAEAASSAKSEFLANMSHEFRTPLNAVLGFADLMKRELFGPLGNEQYRSYVADIIDSGSKLLGMIEVILEFSRSEHAAATDTGAVSSLNDVVEGVLRDLRPAAMQRQIKLAPALDGSIPALAIDAGVLYQITQNLVSNAIKFSKPEESVHIRTSVDADGRPCLAVEDHGMGIPPDLIGKVTQPFWQRQGPLVRAHDGVGLGLSIVQAHVDHLGGELYFDSQVDHGTTVTVRFPATRVSETD